MIQASREDDHELVRSEAKKAIYKIGHPITADPPISSLKNENNIISEDAADPREYDHLVEALKDKTWDARLNKALRSRISGVISGVNARGLGEIKDVRAVDPLIRALKDKRRQIRDAAARALGEIKNVKAVDPLIQALNDRSWCVRIAASWALGEIGDDRAVDHLNRIISDDQNIFVREEAKVALERKKRFVKLPAALMEKDKDTFMIKLSHHRDLKAQFTLQVASTVHLPISGGEPPQLPDRGARPFALRGCREDGGIPGPRFEPRISRIDNTTIA